MVKLVASDIDGTLLPSYDAQMDPEIFDCIRKLREKGVRFITSSGRQYGNLRHLFAPVKDEIDYLCENGCLIFHDGELVYKREMNQSLARDLIHAINDKKEYELLVSGVNTSYIYENHGDFEHMCRDELHNIVTTVRSMEHLPERYFKISAWCPDNAHALQEMPYWERLFSNDFTVVYSGVGWVDFSPRGVTKGDAIMWYMQKYSLGRDEVMAFGDNYNDETILNDVGYSFAMKSAPREIRDFSYGTTDNVVKTIRDFFKI